MSKKARTVRVRVLRQYAVVEYAGMYTEHGWLPDMSTRNEVVFKRDQLIEMTVEEANRRIRAREVELI